MATKSYQNHELILTERKARQEKAVIAAARKSLSASEGDALIYARNKLLYALDALDKTIAKLRDLRRVKKTGLQAGRP